MPKIDRSNRRNETVAFGDFLASERHRIFEGATEERRRQLEAAEQAHVIYRAWNSVLEGTREQKHVTGLRYLPETNELLVYLDTPTWTQELSLMREIIRARMERAGGAVSALKFLTSKEGYKRRFQTAAERVPELKEAPSYNPAPLDPETEARIEGDVDGIEDEKLRQALKNAMKASAQLSSAKKNPK